MVLNYVGVPIATQQKCRAYFSQELYNRFGLLLCIIMTLEPTGEKCFFFATRFETQFIHSGNVIKPSIPANNDYLAGTQQAILFKIEFKVKNMQIHARIHLYQAQPFAQATNSITTEQQTLSHGPK